MPGDIQKGSWKIKSSWSWATGFQICRLLLVLKQTAGHFICRAQQGVRGRRVRTVPSPRSPGKYRPSSSICFRIREMPNLKKTETNLSNLPHSGGMPWQTGASSIFGRRSVFRTGQGLCLVSTDAYVGSLGLVCRRYSEFVHSRHWFIDSETVRV